MFGLELHDLIIHHPHSHEISATIWLTGMVWLAVSWLLGILGYLIWAREPNADVVGAAMTIAVFVSLLWPLFAGAALLWATVMGPRTVVQALRRPPRLSKDQRIAALQRRTAELEAQIDRQPDGIDIALEAS